MFECTAVRGRMAGLLLLCMASALLLAAVGAIPPPEDAARMARFVLHSCDWGALATLSAQEGLRGRPFANIFSLSDGPPGPFGGSGVPYLYLTDMEISVQDLEVNSNASLTVSLAQTPYCRRHRYDPQNPLCAHIIFVGSIVKVNDSEAVLAKKALFSRHPEMESWPKDHNWFFAKFNITNIWVLDYFGGLKIVTPEEYYSVKPYDLLDAVSEVMRWKKIRVMLIWK
ncbi:protein CREG1 isoform X1 [Empidonax traillii]|uniref:protein CREG1 isoform X1 n=2 Tax=Empidonax traillii TaxID=164674 RepID=UPI000FFD6930|nr:protein CREG1 isoform X1 [Empidonax traillii]